jgi:magnesium-transporting ATPase (P-type)
VTMPLMFYSYFQAGLIETGICYFVFYLVCCPSPPLSVSCLLVQVFSAYDLTFTDLAKTKNNYFTSAPTGSFTSAAGDVYSVHEQKHILAIAQGSWYLMIVIGQAVHIWACRTTKISLFQHGVFTNRKTNVAVVVALCLGIIVVYTPGIQSVVMAYNPHSLPLLYGALLSAACFFVLTEGRKWLLRNFPNTSWFLAL